MTLNPSATVYIPKALKKPSKVRYTADALRAVRPLATEVIRSKGAVDYPPFPHIPTTLIPLLSLPSFNDFVDIDAARLIVQDLELPPDPALINYYCVKCASGPRSLQTRSTPTSWLRYGLS